MNTNYVYPSAQVGEFRLALLYGSGPASYATAGDPVYNPGANEYINFPMSVLSASGNYRVAFEPTSVGLNIVRAGAPSPSQSGWKARWFNVGGATTGSGVLSVTITGGGTYTGTVPGVTFAAAPAGGTTATGTAILNGAGTAVVGVLITNPGAGYLTAPAVTFSTGGATGTAVLSSAGSSAGSEVAATTNLSGETIQFASLVSSL